MNYKQVTEFYPTAIGISTILFKNAGFFQITSRTFILGKDMNEVVITPQQNESTITLTSVQRNILNCVKLSEIDADLWFNLSMTITLPFSFECMEKLKGLDKNFHILMSAFE